MPHARDRWTWIGLLLTLGLSTGAAQCDCDSSQNCSQDEDCAGMLWTEDCVGRWACVEGGCLPDCQDGCAQLADCEDLEWPASMDCTEASGHCECQAESCVPVCTPEPECDLAADCDGLTWPGDAGCAQADGHWECQQGACEGVCDAIECDEHADCIGEEWPLDNPGLDCTEATGHWECETHTCVAYCNQECTFLSQCMLRDWPEVCPGHWSCELGRCRAICDPTGCGDAVCDPDLGETETSCPADCVEACASVSECLDRTWRLPCIGAWACLANTCTPLCDYTQCGDGLCDPAAGEDTGGCPDDCLTGCVWPEDCLGETWSQLCTGHWNCFAGACQAVCDSVRCGDGTCMPGQGEDGANCSGDCGYGPCSQAEDCAAYPWPEGCGGRWSCSGQGACQSACDAGCGDAACEVLAGETPDGCPDDCAAYACLTSGDCDPLSLPAGCTGRFLCVERVCRPICD
ncbi:MAG TPA: hypothetical protein P5076_18275 [Myxococcota bacterium]|nr:hypothetical protein [Myxococcota bacterium]